MFIKYYEPNSADRFHLLNTLYCREFSLRKYHSKREGKDKYELIVDVDIRQDGRSVVRLCVRDDESTILVIFDELVAAIQAGDKVFDLTLCS